MRAHVVEHGRIVNTIEVDSLDALPGLTLIDAAQGGQIGDVLTAEGFVGPVEPARAAKDAELTAACAAAITAGVVLDVTGEALTYPTGVVDQLNISGVVSLTLLGVADDWTQDLTTRDAAGDWARRPHSAAQVQALGRAVAAHVDACRARLAARRMALAAAVTGEEIRAVMW